MRDSARNISKNATAQETQDATGTGSSGEGSRSMNFQFQCNPKIIRQPKRIGVQKQEHQEEPDQDPETDLLSRNGSGCKKLCLKIVPAPQGHPTFPEGQAKARKPVRHTGRTGVSRNVGLVLDRQSRQIASVACMMVVLKILNMLPDDLLSRSSECCCFCSAALSWQASSSQRKMRLPERF